jgi:flagellar motility protein MotE (MotC chaperone)
MRDFRLIPIVLIATACLFALKVLGLVLDGGYMLADADSVHADAPMSATQASMEGAPVIAAPATIPAAPQPTARQSWIPEFFNAPDITGAHGSEAADAPKPVEKPKPVEPPPSPGGTVIPIDNTDHPTSPAERAILEHLQTRRQELDARAREIDIRDSLVKEAERRLDARASELKDIEARITAATQKKEEADAARLKGLIVMYENMKPKDAAKVFDRLDLKVLIDLASTMNPRRMSDIMAQMQPENAERLTVELANKGGGVDKALSNEDLPKIEGKPTTQDGNPNGVPGSASNGPPGGPSNGAPTAQANGNAQ